MLVKISKFNSGRIFRQILLGWIIWGNYKYCFESWKIVKKYNEFIIKP